MLRKAARHPYRWLAVIALGLAGCGSSRPAATPVPVLPPASSTSSTPTTSSTTAAPRSSSSTTTPTTTATTPTGAATTTPTTAPTTAASATTSTTQTQAAQTVDSCGSVDFGPSSSYLATGITATASDCSTARTVASASRPHQFDPPPANAPVPGFTAEGFTCVGQRDSASMLALSDYRCTRGSSVVTFERS